MYARPSEAPLAWSQRHPGQPVGQCGVESQNCHIGKVRCRQVLRADYSPIVNVKQPRAVFRAPRDERWLFLTWHLSFTGSYPTRVVIVARHLLLRGQVSRNPEH